MKKTCGIALLGIALFANAQRSDHQLYLKGNALLIPIGVVNIGAEYQVAPKYTMQADVLISPWKSFAGNHAQIYMGHVEGRYYFSEAFHKWYIGANAGAGLFDLTKWNYTGTGKFQRGFNYMLGAVVGYQFKWKERWNIDVFLGGGSSQGFYHGYEDIPPNTWIRYEAPKNGKYWNRSGELLPYRGGIMLSYKIK